MAHRCSELTNLKRGYPGQAGPVGPQGRDGLPGISGRDGAAGRDGRDCPCQYQGVGRVVEERFGASFTSRNKRTAIVLPTKNATIIRFGKTTCPNVEGLVPLKGGKS